MQILNTYSVLDRLAGTLISGHAVEVPALHAAAKEQYAACIGEVPVHAVVNR